VDRLRRLKSGPPCGERVGVSETGRRSLGELAGRSRRARSARLWEGRSLGVAGREAETAAERAGLVLSVPDARIVCGAAGLADLGGLGGEASVDVFGLDPILLTP
jgi:hypothetical protein